MSDFLKLRWWKFIFSILLVVFLIVVFVMSKNFVSVSGELACLVLDSKTELDELREQNNTELFEIKLAELREDVQDKIGTSGSARTGFVFLSNQIVGTDFFYPVPCSIVDSYFCRHYYSEEAFDCANNLAEAFGFEEASIFNVDSREYKPLGYGLLIVNWILIFVICYFVSCLIGWVVGKIRKRKELLIENELLIEE